MYIKNCHEEEDEMRDEVIEILAMINPAIDAEDEDLNIAEDLDSMDIIALIAELEDSLISKSQWKKRQKKTSRM